MNFKYKEYQLLRKNNPNEILQINHFDKNAFNNNVNNVEWVLEVVNQRRKYSDNIIQFNGKLYKGKLEKRSRN